eukprot:3449255-Pyramimonas_sp.AAC.2
MCNCTHAASARIHLNVLPSPQHTQGTNPEAPSSSVCYEDRTQRFLPAVASSGPGDTTPATAMNAWGFNARNAGAHDSQDTAPTGAHWAVEAASKLNLLYTSDASGNVALVAFGMYPLAWTNVLLGEQVRPAPTVGLSEGLFARGMDSRGGVREGARGGPMEVYRPSTEIQEARTRRRLRTHGSPVAYIESPKLPLSDAYR